jgi:hypothetical protein
MAASHASISCSTESLRKVGRALLSVSDKTGLQDLAKYLASQSVELLSTGGSAAKMREAGLPVVDVADHTGSPEILDGRVKTLHPKIHGGILAARGNDKHEAEMKEHDIAPIDIVVLNLYPFTNTVAKVRVARVGVGAGWTGGGGARARDSVFRGTSLGGCERVVMARLWVGAMAQRERREPYTTVGATLREGLGGGGARRDCV